MLACVIIGAMAIGAPGLKEERKPARIPEGRWAVERWVVDGIARAEGALRDYVVVYTTNTCSLERDGMNIGTETTEFREAGGVKQVDFSADDLPGAKRGIWKLDGDTVTVCESEAGGERPTDFTAPAGSKRTLIVLRRIKEK
jgi:uncharacterized protein (TIGR03067 family)